MHILRRKLMGVLNVFPPGHWSNIPLVSGLKAQAAGRSMIDYLRAPHVITYTSAGLRELDQKKS